MKIKITGWCALVHLLSLCPLAAQETAQSIFNFTLQTAGDSTISLSEIQKKKVTLLIMVSPECPICQKYTHVLHLLYKDYKAKNVAIYLVFPGTYFDLQTIRTYLSEQLLDYPALLDKDYQLTKFLKARITPEAFVITAEGEVVYSGMIDNWYYGLGKKRGVVTEEYVKDALNAEIEGSPVTVKRTEPVGCPIYGLKKE